MSFNSDSAACATCGKSFIGRGFHCLTHRPKKQYRCIECGKTFGYTRSRRKICLECRPLKAKAKEMEVCEFK